MMLIPKWGDYPGDGGGGITLVIDIQSLQESIDTPTPAGKLTFHIFAALAEFERDMIRERTRAGLSPPPTNGSRA